MRLFSKIAFLFNVSFLVTVVFWYIEKHSQHEGGTAMQIMPLSWYKSTLVTLGYTAIIVNALFLLLAFIFYSFKANIKIPRWIIIFNIIVFCGQVYFHFILK
jgi:hypothetical protein